MRNPGLERWPWNDRQGGLRDGGGLVTVIPMKLDYTIQIWQEGNQFIGHAMPIDVASSGHSPEGARQAVDEAVKVFLSTAAEHGTLREVLEDAGYRRSRGAWCAPVWAGIEQRSILAPIPSR